MRLRARTTHAMHMERCHAPFIALPEIMPILKAIRSFTGSQCTSSRSTESAPPGLDTPRRSDTNATVALCRITTIMAAVIAICISQDGTTCVRSTLGESGRRTTRSSLTTDIHRRRVYQGRESAEENTICQPDLVHCRLLKIGPVTTKVLCRIFAQIDMLSAQNRARVESTYGSGCVMIFVKFGSSDRIVRGEG